MLIFISRGSYQENKQTPSSQPFGGPCFLPGLSFPGAKRWCWAALVLSWLESQSGRNDPVGSFGSLPTITVS